MLENLRVQLAGLDKRGRSINPEEVLLTSGSLAELDPGTAWKRAHMCFGARLLELIAGSSFDDEAFKHRIAMICEGDLKGDFLSAVAVAVVERLYALTDDISQEFILDSEKGGFFALVYHVGSTRKALGLGRNFQETFLGELNAGTQIASRLIELVPAVFQKQFGFQIPAEKCEAILRAPGFTKITLTLGRLGAHGEKAFLYEVLKPSLFEHRGCYDPDKFLLIEEGSTLVLQLKPEVLAEVRRACEAFNKEGVRSFCPAAYAHTGERGEGPTVLDEYTRWLVELFIRHYVPRVAA